MLEAILLFTICIGLWIGAYFYWQQETRLEGRYRRPERITPHSTWTEKPFDQKIIVPEESVDKANESLPLHAMSSQDLAQELSENMEATARRHRHRLRKHHYCFEGREAVSWFATRFQISRVKAVHVGQRLLEEGYLESLDGTGAFIDNQAFYRSVHIQATRDVTVAVQPEPDGRLPVSLENNNLMEGWLEIHHVLRWHKYYFVQRDFILAFYDKSPLEGGSELGTIDLEGTQVIDVDEENSSIDIENKAHKEIYHVQRRTRLPVGLPPSVPAR